MRYVQCRCSSMCDGGSLISGFHAAEPRNTVSRSAKVFCSGLSFPRMLGVSRLESPEMRRSTIEVHPTFSEAPHLRSSIPHPKTDFSKKQIASRRITPWPESTKRFFQDWHSDDFGVNESRLSETKYRKCATSSVERGQIDWL